MTDFAATVAAGVVPVSPTENGGKLYWQDEALIVSPPGLAVEF